MFGPPPPVFLELLNELINVAATVQVEPSYVSVLFDLSGGPPDTAPAKPIAAVCVPPLPIPDLAVFKFCGVAVVQDEPSYSVVCAVFEGPGLIVPPKRTPVVCVPAPAV